MGRKGPNLYAHQLADSQIKSGKAITVGVLNEILAYSNILVSEDRLNYLINMPRFVFTNLDKIETRRLIQDKLGLPHSKTQRRGVYIFTCIDTNEKYLGSSCQLPLRLRGYFNQTDNISGKLIPLIKAKSLASFKLEVICLPDYSEFRPEIVLEQYFLLDPSFKLNTIKVSNNPSGSTAKPQNLTNKAETFLLPFCCLISGNHQPMLYLRRNRIGKYNPRGVACAALFHLTTTWVVGDIYLYNRDKSILYFVSNKKDYVERLGIHYATLEKKMEKGLYYLGKYLLTTTQPTPGVKRKNMSIEDVILMLDKDKAKLKKKEASSKASSLFYNRVYRR